MTAAERRIGRVEAVAADALVCRVRVDDDGWRLRFNDGVTRRGNSVLPERAGRDALAVKIDRAEAFYRVYDAVTRFQLTVASQPRALTLALAERGYRSGPGALVQTVDLSRLAAASGVADSAAGVDLSGSPSLPWLEVLGRGSGASEAALRVRRANLEAVPAPKAFVGVDVGGALTAVGFAVVARPWMGVFNMATLPQWRRRGAARRVLAAMAAWGLQHGAARAYLQVHPDNAGARALYASLGFVTHHAYDYWEAPD